VQDFVRGQVRATFHAFNESGLRDSHSLRAVMGVIHVAVAGLGVSWLAVVAVVVAVAVAVSLYMQNRGRIRDLPALFWYICDLKALGVLRTVTHFARNGCCRTTPFLV